MIRHAFFLLVATGFAILSTVAIDVSSVLSGSIRGQQLQNKNYPFEVTVATDGTDVVLALSIPKDAAKIGWVAIGTGMQMAGSDMYIAWPNSDGSWTLSHRTASSEVEPSVKSGGDIQLVDSLTTKSASANPQIVAFKRPASGSNLEAIDVNDSQAPFIWAFSSKKPSSSSADAELEEHDTASGSVSTYSATAIDFTASLGTGNVSDDTNTSKTAATGGTSATDKDSASMTENGDSPTQTADTSNETQTKSTKPSFDPLKYRHSLAIAHALLGAAAWVILSPLAVLIARFARSRYAHALAPRYVPNRSDPKPPTWVRAHENIQRFLTLPLTFICISLAILIINSKKGSHFQGTHQVFGMFILLGLTLQLTIGWVIHELKHKGTFVLAMGVNRQHPKFGQSWVEDGRLFIQFRNKVHILLGSVLIFSGFYQCYTGFDLLPKNQVEFPAAMKTAVPIIAGVFLFLYFVSLVKLIFDRRKFLGPLFPDKAFGIAIFGFTSSQQGILKERNGTAPKKNPYQVQGAPAASS